MKTATRKLWMAASLLMAVGLVLAACAPAAPAPTPAPALPTAGPTSAPTLAPRTTTTPGVTPAPLLPTPTPAPVVEKPRTGGILLTVVRGDAVTYDGHQERLMYTQNTLSAAYSLLIQNDPQDEARIIGDLAERWEMSPDGKAWIFYLRKGVKFHDGKPATSADVKISFERIAWPPKGVRSPRESLFMALEKVETPDEHTVKFVLKYPQASFLATVAAGPFNWIYPKHVLEEKGDMTKVVMGTGPFKFKEYSRGVSIDLVKNPDYFVPGRPYLDGITFYVINDLAARFAAVRTHRIQLTTLGSLDISPGERDVLQREVPQVVRRSTAVPSNGQIVFHMKRKPFDDVRVRRAVHLAFDRQGAIKVSRKGDAELGTYILPGTGYEIPREELLRLPGYRQPKEADIAEAKRLLAEAGHPKGFKTSIIVPSFPLHLDLALFTQGELAKIGIDATLEPKDFGALEARIFAHDFALYVSHNSISVADPDLFIGQFFLKGAGMNYGEYENQKLEDLYVKQSQSTDSGQRKKLLREIENILLEDLPSLSHYWTTRYAFWWPEVRGWAPQSTLYLNHKYQDVWLAQ